MVSMASLTGQCCFLLLMIACLTGESLAQKTVLCPLRTQAGAIEADLYGHGSRGVILAHGGQFHKESWKKQAEVLANSGFLVLAVSFRGDHFNPDGSPGSFGETADNVTDVLAGVACLKHAGASTIFAVGASMGGDAVGEANAQSAPGVISRTVFLGSSGGDAPAKLTGRKLYIVAREDRSGDGLRLPGITDHYQRAPQPKQLVILDGKAHAQFLFDTDQGTRALAEIVNFFSAP